ncbi:hypothetical protein [Paenibacillus alkalitolerans]|uniref:hypothetical protein n=1 Tax=Paenibacillus alkalitolerans TaxID=2799335 RepID=UPI0018F4D914|nr:hypothetical protein [Paenibacillus alkalitolerans]
MRARILALGAFAAVLLLNGCGADRNVESHYNQDGYMGLSDSNPNFRTNPTHHNYKKDRQLMRQALREMGLDKRSTIVINGPEVTVTIHLNEDVSGEEAEAIRWDAYSLLKGNNPRYNYNILVE